MNLRHQSTPQNQMQENDIEKALKYNGIHLKEIKFNNNVIC